MYYFTGTVHNDLGEKIGLKFGRKDSPESLYVSFRQLNHYRFKGFSMGLTSHTKELIEENFRGRSFKGKKFKEVEVDAIPFEKQYQLIPEKTTVRGNTVLNSQKQPIDKKGNVKKDTVTFKHPGYTIHRNVKKNKAEEMCKLGSLITRLLYGTDFRSKFCVASIPNFLLWEGCAKIDIYTFISAHTMLSEELERYVYNWYQDILSSETHEGLKVNALTVNNDASLSGFNKREFTGYLAFELLFDSKLLEYEDKIPEYNPAPMYMYRQNAQCFGITKNFERYALGLIVDRTYEKFFPEKRMSQNIPSASIFDKDVEEFKGYIPGETETILYSFNFVRALLPRTIFGLFSMKLDDMFLEFDLLQEIKIFENPINTLNLSQKNIIGREFKVDGSIFKVSKRELNKTLVEMWENLCNKNRINQKKLKPVINKKGDFLFFGVEIEI